VAKHKDHPVLGAAVQKLGKATEAVGGISMKFVMWNGQGKHEQVPLAANRFLSMMAETCIGWLLLEQALIALEKLPTASNAEKPFYEGKRYAAQYFAFNLLPNVLNHAAVINGEDASALEIPQDALGAG
jgi:hypothetical protein